MGNAGNKVKSPSCRNESESCRSLGGALNGTKACPLLRTVQWLPNKTRRCVSAILRKTRQTKGEAPNSTVVMIMTSPLAASIMRPIGPEAYCRDSPQSCCPMVQQYG